MKKEVENKGKYKAILFDLGGVLSLGNQREEMKGVHSEVARKLGFTMDHYLDAIDGSYPDAIKGKISGSEAMKKMAKNLNTTPKKLEYLYKKIYKKNFKWNKSLYNFMVKLKKAGYKVGIVSDIWPIAKEVFFYKKYYRHFDLVMASCDVGSRKTHEKIFKIALRRIHSKPSETIFIDNEKWNMPAPKALGIKAMLFQGNDKLIERLNKLGVKV